MRLPHVLDWLASEKPDVLCLQETKQEDSKFPYEALKAAGYNAIHSGQKTYNGVAILTPHTIEDPHFGITDFADEQKRVLTATINGIRIICAYIPNGQSLDSDKYQYKLGWLKALNSFVANELKQHPKLALLGDYNIAPEDRDVHDPKAWEGQVLVSQAERDAFQQRARRIDARNAVGQRRIHVEMRVDEGRRDEIPRRIDDASGVGTERRRNRRNGLAGNADVGHGSVGQGAALDEEVEGHLSPFLSAIGGRDVTRHAYDAQRQCASVTT